MISKDVVVCGVPYRMTIVDGGVLFSNKSGFSGFVSRSMFSYRNSLWYLDTSESTYGKIAAVHIVKMHRLLCDLIAPDHCESDGSKFQLRFVPDRSNSGKDDGTSSEIQKSTAAGDQTVQPGASVSAGSAGSSGLGPDAPIVCGVSEAGPDSGVGSAGPQDPSGGPA